MLHAQDPACKMLEPTTSRCLHCDAPCMLVVDPWEKNACDMGFTTMYTVEFFVHAECSRHSKQLTGASSRSTGTAHLLGLLTAAQCCLEGELVVAHGCLLHPGQCSSPLGCDLSSETGSGCCPHTWLWLPCGTRADSCCCCACAISKSMRTVSSGRAVASAAPLGKAAEAAAAAAASSWGGAPLQRSSCSRLAGGAELGAACACSCSWCLGAVSVNGGPAICSACWGAACALRL